MDFFVNLGILSSFFLYIVNPFEEQLKKVLNYIYETLDRYTIFKVKLLNLNAREPTKADKGSAGYDIYSTAIVEIPPGTRNLVPTGISIEIPTHYYLRCAPRSGMSLKGIDVGAGVIDSSYRGEIFVLLINNSKETYIVENGDKIAQLIMERCCNTDILVYDDLNDSDRGDSGFGSSGF